MHTVAALTQLQHQAFSLAGDLENFESWRLGMIKLSPTFQFWDTVLRLELIIFMFVRAHREKDFNIYIETLENLTGFFFALDHYNYARWLPIHIRDMKSLPATFFTDFKQHWVVSKTKNRFSSMPLDQSHEQENAKVKGKGGVIGLTENPTALEQWLICGPEIAKCLSEFESQTTRHETSAIHLHHEEGFAAQTKIQQQVKSLIDVINTFGNPFEDDCPELLVLNSRVCMHEFETVRSIEALGKSKYEKYVADVIDNRTGSIHDTIKKNSLSLFNTPKCKAKSKSAKHLMAQCSNASLFGRPYIANQRRDGDLGIFFSHENQSVPPSLSDFGNIHLGQKSALLTCLDCSNQPTPPDYFDSKMLDGSAVVHFLSTSGAKTFSKYASKVFLPFIFKQLQTTSRLDVIWDRYISCSIKEMTRIHRGSGLRTKVSGQIKLPQTGVTFERCYKQERTV